ncbi:hypothetical protein [Falsibacillus pallidus]|uniref:Amidohydrolase family protein n=1 Tax=Falsibacillus pallidus TaxID=493781 RepID=A0A370GII0_9BACI|nr:hypothetical protein [Falsibacillus pallidus]RDI42999.1 hypothetical protein DFR59_10449 [Falsibacillus pallidus]
MTYVISNATLLQKGELKDASVLIKENKIAAIREAFNFENALRMDVSSFILAPTFTMLDFSLPATDFFAFKQYMIDHFLSKGCTTILSPCEITHERDLDTSLKRHRMSLLSCPIDYCMAIKVPIRNLSPSLMRKCSRYKIPLILVEISNVQEIKSLPWGWIKDAMFPYNPVLVPFLSTGLAKKEQQSIIKNWQIILKNEKIPHIPQEMMEKTPILPSTLKKIGIYPKRGILAIGGEVSYNLFPKSSLIDRPDSIYYDILRPSVTVYRDQLVYVNDDVSFFPGMGREVKINRPGFFV